MDINKILYTTKVILTGILFSILFVPYAEVFYPIGNCVDETCWTKITILEDWILAIMYVPYILLSCFYLWKGKPQWLRFVLLVISFLLLFNCLFGIVFPIQDFSPLFGILIMLCLHCIALFLLTFESKILSFIQRNSS